MSIPRASLKKELNVWHLGCERQSAKALFVALAVVHQKPSGEANKGEGAKGGELCSDGRYCSR